MLVRKIIRDDNVNYKRTALFVGIGDCDWKCCKEAGMNASMCQNSELAKVSAWKMTANECLDVVVHRKSFEQSVVIGGLEPFRDMNSLLELCRAVSSRCEFVDWDVVIYTGYYYNEIVEEVELIKESVGNHRLIIKFGRYDPALPPVKDSILGVELASSNQYAKIIKDQNEY
jgi:organic radical activating enzyme